MNKANQPVNWTKVSTQALNVIKGFMEIFNFDDMLHGSAKFTNPKLTSSSLFNRVNTASEATSPVSSPIRNAKYVDSTSENLKSPSRFISNRNLLYHETSFGFVFAQKVRKMNIKEKLF